MRVSRFLHSLILILTFTAPMFAEETDAVFHEFFRVFHSRERYIGRLYQLLHLVDEDAVNTSEITPTGVTFSGNGTGGYEVIGE